MKFYTYLWLRENGTPYYVGKGSGNRAFIKTGHRVNPPPQERIVLQFFRNEQDSFFAERFLIALYGRMDLKTGCLANLTEGGEGASGQSEDLRRQKSLTLLGHPVLEETKEKIRLARAKQDMSWCVKMQCKRGHIRTPEAISSNGTCLECKKLLRPSYSHLTYLQRRLREGHISEAEFRRKACDY